MKYSKYKFGLSVIISLFVLYDILALSSYNNDWNAYLNIYEGVSREDDLFFQYLVDLANSIGLSFQQFFTLIQTFTFAAILYTYSSFVKKGIFALLFVLLTICSPNLSILIRYYLAFAIYLISLVPYVKKQYTVAFSLAFIAFLTHSGILLCFPIYLLYNWIIKQEQKSIFKKFFLFAVFLVPIKIFIIDILANIGLSVFSSYKNQIASILATIFVDIGYFVWFGFTYYLHSCLIKTYAECLKDKVYMLLFTCMLYPIIFLFISNIMILQIRLYEPLIILAVAYIYYVTNKYKFFKRNINVIVFTLIVISSILKYYLLGAFTGGESEWVKHYREIIISNKESVFLNL